MCTEFGVLSKHAKFRSKLVAQDYVGEGCICQEMAVVPGSTKDAAITRRITVKADSEREVSCIVWSTNNVQQQAKCKVLLAIGHGHQSQIPDETEPIAGSLGGFAVSPRAEDG